jgi:hypothetical protein
MENSALHWKAMCKSWADADDKLRKARAERNLWRHRWKAGAFEMDAATMANLAEQETESLNFEAK